MPVRLLPVGTASNPCLSLVLFLFLPMVSMEETPGGSHPMVSMKAKIFCLLIGQIPQVSGWLNKTHLLVQCWMS